MNFMSSTQAKSPGFFWLVQNPECFHGWHKKGPFFEGWYFKLINENGLQRLAVILGIYIGRSSQDSHAFIQVLDDVKGKSFYIQYPIEEFIAESHDLKVSLVENQFSKDHIHLDINRPEIQIFGTLRFIKLNPWTSSWISPGIMGIFGWVPGLQCYHGVVSLDHQIIGSLNIDGMESKFTGGRGYIEKDWGTAMPNAWIWMQSNHFDLEGVSLTVSIADIPMGKFSFTGFIAGFLMNGRLYKFATYTGAKFDRLVVTEKMISFRIQDSEYCLEIIAHRKLGARLQAPTASQMDRGITESLSSDIHVTLKRSLSHSSEILFEGIGKFAGLEAVGDLQHN